MKTYCPLPFRHLFVEPRGIKPCCSYTNLYQHGIDSWINSDELKNLQHNILTGKIDPGCEYCINAEKKSSSGTRLEALSSYGQLSDHTTQIDYIDYRASNICNFRCRSCDPFYSNGIAQEARRHPELQTFYAIPDNKIAPTTQADKKWILENLSKIKKLMFTGGEPTKIPEVREIIELIRQEKIKDINLLITSNASFDDDYWFSITEEMPNLHWTLSLDAVGDRAEIIRDGTRWSRVKDNIERMFDISHSVNIGTVVTNLSLLGLGELFDFVNGLEKKYSHRANGRTQLIEVCAWPDQLSPYNWPEEKKPRIISYLRSLLEQELQEKQRQIVTNLIDTISVQTFDPVLWQNTLDFNQAIDAARDQSSMPLLV